MTKAPARVAVVTCAGLAVAALAGCGQQDMKPTEDFAYSCQNNLKAQKTEDIGKKAPKTSEWTQGADGNTYPRSSAYGGCQETNGWTLGHSHNSAGAVFAATDYLSGPAAAGQAPQDEETIKKVYAAGPVRDQMPSSSPSAAASSSDSSFSGSGARLVGYDLNEKDNDHITVSAHIDTDMFVSGKIIVPLVWEDGDWKVQAHSTDEPVNVQLGSGKDPQVAWEE